MTPDNNIEKRKVRRKHSNHGMTGTGTYKAWENMHSRCSNPNSTKFKNYGARGVQVCSRWYHFENFLIDMGVRPLGLTLDRIKNHKHYTPDNCRWATQSQQRMNRRAVGMRRILLPLIE